MDFSWMRGSIGGVPIWLIVIGGGVAVAYIAPKLLKKSGTTTGAAQSANGTTALPDTLDPVTGVPYAIESTIDPHTGLPVYYSPVATGASGATTTSTTDPYAAQKTQAITAWQQHTGQTWSGPPGSYPAGWIAGGNVPGAATLLSPGHVSWVVPLAPAGSGLPPVGSAARWPYVRRVGHA